MTSYDDEVTSLGVTLRVEMTDWDNFNAYAEYNHFYIGSSFTNYTLSSSLSYSGGDAGDSLTAHRGYQFTTIDRDNDVWPDNCAVRFKGAWWYAACHSSNLNGEYIVNGIDVTYAKNVVWSTFKGYYYSLKYVSMMIKPDL